MMLTRDLDGAINTLRAAENILIAAANTALADFSRVREFLVELEQQAQRPQRQPKPGPAKAGTARPGDAPSGLRLIDGNPKARPPLLRPKGLTMLDGGGGDRPSA